MDIISLILKRTICCKKDKSIFTHCDKCNECTKKKFTHCDKCNNCHSVHLDKYCEQCNKCTYTEFIHCNKCNSCHHYIIKYCNNYVQCIGNNDLIYHTKKIYSN
jgi:hypothetical protein